ncbi:MAG: hypothetical protein ACK52H_08220 [Burkholderiales bacterium]
MIKIFLFPLCAIFCVNTVCANDLNAQVNSAIGKMIENFDLKQNSLKIDEYTNLIKIHHRGGDKILTFTHEVDVNAMINRDYLDDSRAVAITNANTQTVCSSGFGILVKNGLVNVEHVFVEKKSKHLVLKYLISSKDFEVANEK